MNNKPVCVCVAQKKLNKKHNVCLTNLCIYLCICLRIYLCICIYLCIYLCMCVCVYVCALLQTCDKISSTDTSSKQLHRPVVTQLSKKQTNKKANKNIHSREW